MKVLSIFCDESGDFGEYEPHSPFYIVSLVFHEQDKDIDDDIYRLNSQIRNYGLPDHTIHTAPLIRNEGLYGNMPLQDRKRIFNSLYNFVRKANITYHNLVVDKKQCVIETDLVVKLSKQLSSFLREHIIDFLVYDQIICYYDYGQRELTNILVTALNVALNNVEFRKVSPAEYRLFQAADLLCTMELLTAKSERKALSKSEILFFRSERDLNKQYLRALKLKRVR